MKPFAPSCVHRNGEEEIDMTATAQASKVIPAGPDEVWDTLTSRKGMKAYMMGADVETDWQVGGPITLHGKIKGKPYEDHGEVRSRSCRAAGSGYTHASGSAPDAVHLVTFELAPRDGGTEVTVIQENLNGRITPADLERRRDNEQTWAMMLEGLAKAVAH